MLSGRFIAAIAFTSLVSPALGARAETSVGTITVCYYSAECAYTSVGGIGGVVDGPAFQFSNSGTKPITGARFAIAANKALGVKADSFSIGTINAGASFVLIPGATNDRKKRTNSSLFFYYVGPTSPRDTSDSEPNSNAITFQFNGKIGTSNVTSGKIVVGASAGPSADGSVAQINFLGGPGNADGPCNDCVKPMVIATLTQASAPNQSKPESDKDAPSLTFPPKAD